MANSGAVDKEPQRVEAPNNGDRRLGNRIVFGLSSLRATGTKAHPPPPSLTFFAPLTIFPYPSFLLGFVLKPAPTNYPRFTLIFSSLSSRGILRDETESLSFHNTAACMGSPDVFIEEDG